MAKHTPDWKVDAGDLCIGNQIIASGRDFGPDRATLEEKKANVRLAASAPELLLELKLANKIIMNALNVMNSEQKLAWDDLNFRDDLKDGWALTRNNIREAVIAKAEGQDK